MLAKVYNVQCLDGGSCVVKINVRDEQTFRGMMDEGLGGYWKDKVSVNDGHDCVGDDGRELVYGGGGVLTSVRSVKDFGLVQIFHLISGLTDDCACISGIYHGSGGLMAANSK